MSWLNPTDQDRQTVQQLQQDAPQHFRLLKRLALALRIEPLLLRNARLHFSPDTDIELETDLWFSNIMHSRNAKVCVIRRGIARVLVDELAKEDPLAYQKAWDFVQTHTRHWSAQDQLEQELHLAARRQDSATLQDGLQRMLKTLLATEDSATKRDLSRWIKGAMPTLTTANETDEMAHLLFQYTAAVLGLPATWSNNHQANQASMPEWLLKALPPAKANTLGLQLRAGVLECLEPTVDARHRLTVNLPLPTPVLLTVNDNTAQSRWEALWIGKKIRLPHGLQKLTLQTLEGQQHRFSVNSRRQITENGMPATPAAPLALAYMPGDLAQAQQLADLLKQQGIAVNLLEDQAQKDRVFTTTDRPLLRLWSKASAEYWQKALSGLSQDDDHPFTPGLLLRTDPQVALPSGLDQTHAFDLLDWNAQDKLANTERLMSILRDWLATGELVIPTQPKVDSGNEIEALLQELENPATKPRRRLAIGDRLAALGDPRPGVGVKEYTIIEYAPEIQLLLDELADPDTKPPRRLEIGNQLDEVGDPRFGVGLDDQGLPEIDWVEIPAGSFMYVERDALQTLDLSAFKISRYPVTNKQFQAFIDAGGYQVERWWQDLEKPEPDQPSFKQANRPREMINWYEAIAFTRWLSEQLGVKASLPTIEQWVKSARGTDDRQYPWGPEYRSGFANCKEKDDFLKHASAVGLYQQGNSPYGVADMAGNVWEWCLNDGMHRRNIAINKNATSRVIRGGSYTDTPGALRIAVSSSNNPKHRNLGIGFRIVNELP